MTDAEEVLEPKQWVDRSGSGAQGHDPNLLSQEERELQIVKRAEEEARHGTSGTALGGLGGGPGASSGGSKLQMKMRDEAKSALQAFAASGGSGGAAVQLGIDIATETLTLLSQRENGVQPGALAKSIPTDRPSYTFYRHPAAPDTALFVYVCPGTSKVKERMVYASSRSGVLEAAKSEGVEISKRLEAGVPDEITEQRLNEEVSAAGGEAESGTSTPRGGFSRPKRPGRR